MNLIMVCQGSAFIRIRQLPGTSQLQYRLNTLYLQNIMFKHHIVKIAHIQKLPCYSLFRSSELFSETPTCFKKFLYNIRVISEDVPTL